MDRREEIEGLPIDISVSERNIGFKRVDNNERSIFRNNNDMRKGRMMGLEWFYDVIQINILIEVKIS